ncbi:hypothetical protein ACPESN_01895 [Stutzerimonas marianensis]|uniref:hypothetical protein n=1 Tax=Stutzerimonas marianensis TaxID=2929513 RepID=UPI003C2E059C
MQSRWSEALDTELSLISHYQLYPSLLPWVGQRYETQQVRLLIVGESHYLQKTSRYHHNDEAWYTGLDTSKYNDRHWFFTRNIINNGLQSHWKGKSKLIYKNIEKALSNSGFGDCTKLSPFDQIAYMNYFQRPAQITGRSLVHTSLDRERSADVFLRVMSAIKPDLVIFCSKLAWRAMQSSNVANTEADPRFAVTPHPATRWWHTKMKKHNGKTGKDLFVEAIRQHKSTAIRKNGTDLFF